MKAPFRYRGWSIRWIVVLLMVCLPACDSNIETQGKVPTPFYQYITPETLAQAKPTSESLSLPDLTVDLSVMGSLSSIPNAQDLLDYFLQLINAARRQQGLSPVAWDAFAAQVGRAHAEEMAQNQYMSHWNLLGYGPDVRYSLAGGQDSAMENVFSSWRRYDNGTPVPIDDWRAQIDEAHMALMNSPGHRANILMPEHTHVGIGIAYDAATGEFRVAQEFVNRYIKLEPLPSVGQLGQVILVRGQLFPGSTQPMINLAFEPEPRPMNVAQLNATKTYASPAQFLEAYNVQEQPDGIFQADVKLGTQPGLYHVRIWVKAQDLNPQAADWIIRVQP